MKILQLVTRRQFRGAEVFAAKLSEQLLLNQIQVIFVGLYTPPQPCLEVNRAINIDLHGKKKFLSWSLIRDLVRVIKTEDPDIIQSNGSDTLKYAVFARFLVKKDIPIVYRNISIVSEWVGSHFLKKKFYNFLFSKVDYVTSVGQKSLDDLVKFFNFPKEHTMVIRRGIPIHPQNKENAKKYVFDQFKLSPSSKLVVHVGNFSIEKNQDFLLSVFSHIHQRNPEVKLILIGDGVRVPIIQQSIVDLKLQNTIFLAGFREDIGMFMSAADLFVLCSKVEGVPGVVLEAAAQGTPSLAIDVGGVSEVVIDNVTGILLHDSNVDTFSSTMLKLLNDKPLLEKLGENAFQNVRTNFDPILNASLFIKLYKQLR